MHTCTYSWQHDGAVWHYAISMHGMRCRCQVSLTQQIASSIHGRISRVWVSMEEAMAQDLNEIGFSGTLRNNGPGLSALILMPKHTQHLRGCSCHACKWTHTLQAQSVFDNSISLQSQARSCQEPGRWTCLMCMHLVDASGTAI